MKKQLLFLILISLLSVTKAQKIPNFNLLEIGDQAPAFMLQSDTEKEITLADVEGKIALVEFWASWCAPCRKNMPTLMAIHNEFHGEDFENAAGFEVVAVSLDRNKQIWQQTIEKDSLSQFIHVIATEAWRSKVAKEYGVKRIPAAILLDENGVIIAKNPSEKTLKRMLKKRLPRKGFFFFSQKKH